jgi:DNA-binding CsgD family transcriptional regulator
MRASKIKGASTLGKPLTPQEEEIARLTCEEGLANKDIGEKLSITEHSVRINKDNIYKKLGIHCAPELVRWWYEWATAENGLMQLIVLAATDVSRLKQHPMAGLADRAIELVEAACRMKA